MAISSLIRVLGLLLWFSVSGVVAQGRQGVRKEWRSLSNTEKADYIRAVKCLQSKESVLRTNDGRIGAETRFDDFVYVHITETPEIHFTGQFLPWHRYYVVLHELILRNECGYKGYQPYWDWEMDLPPRGNWLDSPLFDPNTGFGGNGPFIETPEDFVYYGFDMTPLSLTGEGPTTDVRGNALVQSGLGVFNEVRTGGGCVPNGPFKDLRIRLGPFNGTASNPRCLNRDFANVFVEGLNIPGLVQSLYASGNFAEMSSFAEFVHGTGHIGVGGLIGEMGNLYSSPNDPLFFLHHANLDRIWWNWQSRDLPARLSDISGFAFGTGDEQVTLDFKLDLGLFGVRRPIRDFMDIRKLGYTYST